MTEKSDERKIRRGRGFTSFAMTPEWVLDAKISDRAKVLYAMLSRYANDDRQAFPGRRRLAERLGVTLPTLDKAMKELASIGALDIEARFREDGSQTSNVYTLHFEEGSKASDSGGEPSPLSPKEREPVERDIAKSPTETSLAEQAFDPTKVTLVNGRNIPFDALCEECDIDPKSPRVGEVVTALNGRRGKPELGIRTLFWREWEEWAAERGDGWARRLQQVEPEKFEHAVARAITEKARKYRLRMPQDSLLTPTALAKWWLDLERMGGRDGLSAEEVLNLRD